jgi:hypothetical protein
MSLRAVDTEDGWERKVKILGPAESGDAGEMRVAFVDGTVDDWDVDEFVAHKEPPKDLIKSQVGACLFLRATAPALHCTASLLHYTTHASQFLSKLCHILCCLVRDEGPQR